MQKDKVMRAINFGPFSEFGNVVATALTTALFEIHELGESGKERVTKNQFNETALKADLRAEKVMEECVRIHFNTRAQVLWKSEELGELTFGNNPKLQYIASADGIDGTENYETQGNWTYGSMFAIAEGNNPTYDAFVAGGVSLPELGTVVIADKYRGAVFALNVDNGEIEQIPAFDQNARFEDTGVLSDPFRKAAKELIGDRAGKWPRTGSTAHSYYMIATQFYQALVETTRKGNLEIPVGYLFMTLLGGFMLDINGKSLGPKKWLEWGQLNPDGSEDNQPIISATNAFFKNGVLADLSK